MNATILRLYQQGRREQWEMATRYRLNCGYGGTTMAQAALRAAKIQAAFAGRDDVRLTFPPDEHTDLGDLKGDTYNPSANPDIPAARLAREEKEFEERVDRDGVVGMVGEYFDGEEWQHADSVWGFVGEDDARRSGYAEDVMQTTMEAADKVQRCPTCHRPTL